VLVTGAAGRIGTAFAQRAHEEYDLRLMDMDGQDMSALEALGEVATGDLADLDRMKEMCGGIDTVVHLAANPSPSATWGELVGPNITGTYNAYVAAKAAGCRRVIFASSIHAVSGYPSDVQVKTTEPVNPGDMYGVTKCFGEAMGRYMAEQEGLSVIAIRIGGFQPVEAARDPEQVSGADAFVSDDDLVQLIRRCIAVENLRFAVLHGISDNRFKRLDISDARVLVGYEPRDDFFRENPALEPLSAPDSLSTHNLSGGQESGIREEV
jgi:UDP-glucose 4-epimerase